MTGYLLAVAILGALVSGPAWMAYALKRDAERREWVAKRRERELRGTFEEQASIRKQTLRHDGLTFAGQEAYEQWKRGAR